MRDAQVQFTASQFSKEKALDARLLPKMLSWKGVCDACHEELLNQLLHDEEIAKTVASWTSPFQACGWVVVYRPVFGCFLNPAFVDTEDVRMFGHALGSFLLPGRSQCFRQKQAQN